jgi:hypothetical protein
MSVVP